MAITQQSIAIASGARLLLNRKVALAVSALFLILSLWQASALFDESGLVPTPLGILNAIPIVVTDPDFWLGTQYTTLAIMQGLLIGTVFGTFIGLLIGRVAWVRGILAPYVSGLYSVPLLALIPLVTIWLGYSGESRLALVSVAALLPCIVSTSDGARRVPQELEDVAFVIQVPKHRILFDLVFPAALPYIIAGVNVAIGRAIVAAIAVEFLASVQGLGRFILIQSRSFNPDEAIVGVITLVILGLLGTGLVETLRRSLAPWHVKERK